LKLLRILSVGGFRPDLLPDLFRAFPEVNIIVAFPVLLFMTVDVNPMRLDGIVG
jgi:hypothetical protein